MESLSETSEEQAAKELQEFLATPVGMARKALERGDAVFQVQLPLRRQIAETTTTVNSICSEGWELLSVSVAFVETGQGSDGKVKGRMFALYVFKQKV